MPKQFFITGTDTGIGKTVVSALMCAATSGFYWKPIQTGAIEGTDRCAVMRYAQLPPERTLPEVYCFDEPVSPHLAASRAGVRIELERLPQLSTREREGLVVEGAGGVLVPINDKQFMTDLMRWLGLPVLLACKSGLGTINHTLLSLAALRSSGLEVRGVVMVGPLNQANRQAIQRYGFVPVVGTIPWLPEIDRMHLMEVFRNNFDPHLLNS
jgi:dethiobiotin synthetase